MAERLAILDFDNHAAVHVGDIYAELGKRGELIGRYGILIAGHARSRGLVVTTSSLKEFRRVDRFRSEDWPQPN
jgi:tRNA(fMet)-specific endonuclease VapC